MTNINNQTQNLFAIDAVQDLFQELTSEQAAAIQGGAYMEFFEHADFSGASFSVSGDVPVMPPFNNMISSAIIHSGEWVLWSEPHLSGSGIVLGPGKHDLTALNGRIYNDVTSSIEATVE